MYVGFRLFCFACLLEQTWKQENVMQERLDQTTVLLEKLQQVQSDRLSSTPPTHLANVMQPTDTELHLGMC